MRRVLLAVLLAGCTSATGPDVDRYTRCIQAAQTPLFAALQRQLPAAELHHVVVRYHVEAALCLNRI